MSNTTIGDILTPSIAKMTVYIVRKSFATNRYKDRITALTIMKPTGHKSERVFLSYLKETAYENASLLQNHWKKKEQTAS